jgi:hypothetical protein
VGLHTKVGILLAMPVVKDTPGATPGTAAGSLQGLRIGRGEVEVEGEHQGIERQQRKKYCQVVTW